MDTGDALLAAIIAHPGEDTPRLVYADWLQENGQGERAEFIRVQCELARLLPDAAENCRVPWAELGRRERELWQHIGELLPRELGAYLTLGRPATFGNAACAARVHRGFVEAVTCTAADWLAHADAILAAHPVVAVELECRAGDHIVAFVKKCLGLKLVTLRSVELGQQAIVTDIFRVYGFTGALIYENTAGDSRTRVTALPDDRSMDEAFRRDLQRSLGIPPHLADS